MFPEGIYYNKEKHICRTPRVNTFSSLNHLFSGKTRVNKKANSLYLNKKSALVTAKGFVNIFNIICLAEFAPHLHRENLKLPINIKKNVQISNHF